MDLTMYRVSVLFYLLMLGCGDRDRPPPCDPWSEWVTIGSQELVLCSARALQLRADGMQLQAMVDAYGGSLERNGFTLERDTSKPTRVERIYARGQVRVLLGVIGRSDATGVSLKLIP